MKRFLIPIVFTLLAFSCAKVPDESPSGALPFSETKASVSSDLKIDFDRLDTVYFVSNVDIKKYIHFKKLLDPKAKVKNITPFDIQGVTLFYIINYENGWEMISADKRTQPILGRSKKGSFTMKDYEETPWGTWAYMLGLDVLTERTYGPETNLEENENLMFWGSLSSPSLTFPGLKDSTEIPPIIHLPVEPIEGVTGYYELESVTYYPVDTVTVDHLTTTRWSQGGNSINNQFVPYQSNGSGDRAPSGCVAVAGAQMAYFLHNKIGKPTLAPSDGYCYGYVHNYDQAFYNFNSQIWDSMTVIDNTASDLLSGYISQVINTNYGNNGSSSVIRNLRPYFQDWDISCDIDYYDPDMVYNELRYRGMPVIIGAQMRENVFDGHAFIIDSYEYIQQQVRYMYMWHWYEQYLGGLLPWVEDRYEYSTQYLGMTFFHMNWGWGGAYNDMDFAPDGTWEIYDQVRNREYHFDWVRRMLYNFQEI